MKSTYLVVLCSCVGLLACGNDPPPNATASAEPAKPTPAVTQKPIARTPTPTATTTAPGSAITEDEPMTVADFEQEASRDIHLANQEDELALLDKEIAADK